VYVCVPLGLILIICPFTCITMPHVYWTFCSRLQMAKSDSQRNLICSASLPSCAIGSTLARNVARPYLKFPQMIREPRSTEKPQGILGGRWIRRRRRVGGTRVGQLEDGLEVRRLGGMWIGKPWKWATIDRAPRSARRADTLVNGSTTPRGSMTV
jgi:hypothetical protein